MSPTVATPPVDLLRRPLTLLWNQRVITTPLVGQAHIAVPLAGGPPRLDTAARINRYLEQMWVANPVPFSIRVTSVAVTVVADPAADAQAPFRLILMITFDQAAGDAKLDGLHMTRHLEAALEQAA